MEFDNFMNKVQKAEGIGKFSHDQERRSEIMIGFTSRG